MDRITCVDDNSKRNPGYFPGYLTVTLKDGRTFTMDQRYEMGTAQNPLNMEAVSRKFADNLERFYSRERIGQILESIKSFEQLPDPDGFLKLLVRA